MEINNNIDINKNLEKNNQTKFLETTIGKVINTGIDIGLRAILPDFLENQVIEIKDNLFNYGLREGISKTVEGAIELGKSAIGIFTGDFDNINQMQDAIQTGGIIDGVSGILEITVDKIKDMGIINNTIANTILSGKDIILNNVKNNIENNFIEQANKMENISGYINEWKENYENKNFDLMEKAYNKIEKELKELVPLEKIINEAKTIENLHNLIKNNGNNFDITQEQIELANKLI